MKRFFALALALTMLAALAGCGAAPAPAETTAPAAPAETSAPAETAAPAAAETEAPAAGTIVVANGEKPLPQKFDNFIALGNTQLDHLVALDVMPVAASMPRRPDDPDAPNSASYYNDGFGAMYPDEMLADVESLNMQLDASIERIIELAPDFIIASQGDEKHLEKLEAIAPTYLIPNYTAGEDGMRDWKEVHRMMGKLVGKSDKAEENIAAYEALVKSYQEQIGDSVKGKTALIYQSSSTGKGLWMSSKESASQIYTDFGFVLPDKFTLTGDYYAVEELITLNPDYMFVQVGSVEEYEKLANNPIWQSLTAVKEGHVYEYSHYVWTQTNGYLSSTKKLTDVGEFILHGTQNCTTFSKEAK